MEKVIGHLFEIEKKANQIIERAIAEKQELYEENEKAIVELEKKITEENNAKINAILTEAEKELEKERQQLVDSSNKKLNDLEALYRNDHDVLVDKVFQSIILI